MCLKRIAPKNRNQSFTNHYIIGAPHQLNGTPCPPVKVMLINFIVYIAADHNRSYLRFPIQRVYTRGRPIIGRADADIWYFDVYLHLPVFNPTGRFNTSYFGSDAAVPLSPALSCLRCRLIGFVNHA